MHLAAHMSSILAMLEAGECRWLHPLDPNLAMWNASYRILELPA